METRKSIEQLANNQFVSKRGNVSYFVSYGSTIAKKTNGKTMIDRYWYENLSRTTGKYLCRFLGENLAAVRKRVSCGEYALRKLDF